MKLDIKIIIIGVLIGVLAFSSFKCGQYKEKFSSELLKNQQLDSVNNALGQKIYTQEVIITSDREGFKRYTDSMFNLTKRQEKRIKDVISYYQSILKAEIREVEVPYVDTLAMKKWADSVEQRCSDVIVYYEANMMPVPRDAIDSTKDYKIDVTVTRDNLLVNSIQLIDTQHIRFVTLKGGILKKDTYGKRHLFLKKKIEAQVLHTNPLITVLGQQSAQYEPPKKSFISKLLVEAIKAGTFIIIGSQLKL